MFKNCSFYRPFVLILSFVVFIPMSFGVVGSKKTVNEEVENSKTKKEIRMEKRIDRFMKRVENPKGLFKVYLKKHRKKFNSDQEFLDDLEEKAKWGIIGILGGLALMLLLRSELRFIGIIGVVAGIGLLIWSLVE